MRLETSSMNTMRVACMIAMVLSMTLVTPGFSQQGSTASAEQQQQSTASIAPTMPVPKLPYNMPSTRLSQPAYGGQVQQNGPQGIMPGGVSPAAQEPAPDPQEYLSWSKSENSLKVTVSEDGKVRGSQTEATRPVSSMLGAGSQGGTPLGDATAIPPVTPAPAPPVMDETGMIIDNSMVRGPAPPSTPGINRMPAPGVTTIPAPDQIITDAGGEPIRFTPPPPPALPAGVQEAPPIVPATPPPPAPVAEKRGLFGRIFGGGKKSKRETPAMAPPPIISTGPQNGGPPPVAPSPVATPGNAAQNEYVIVQNERGTQFVIAGDTTAGQSGILIPSGVVLQLIGANGEWTTVKSPNGTIGSVQAADIRKANFNEAIQFISSGGGNAADAEAAMQEPPVPDTVGYPQVELPTGD